MIIVRRSRFVIVLHRLIQEIYKHSHSLITAMYLKMETTSIKNINACFEN